MFPFVRNMLSLCYLANDFPKWNNRVIRVIMFTYFRMYAILLGNYSDS